MGTNPRPTRLGWQHDSIACRLAVTAARRTPGRPADPEYAGRGVVRRSRPARWGFSSFGCRLRPSGSEVPGGAAPAIADGPARPPTLLRSTAPGRVAELQRSAVQHSTRGAAGLSPPLGAALPALPHRPSLAQLNGTPGFSGRPPTSHQSHASAAAIRIGRAVAWRPGTRCQRSSNHVEYDSKAPRSTRWTQTHTIWALIVLSLIPGVVVAAFRDQWQGLPAGVRAATYLASVILIVAACSLILTGVNKHAADSKSESVHSNDDS
jgi:hypothetical protein